MRLKKPAAKEPSPGAIAAALAALVLALYLPSLTHGALSLDDDLYFGDPRLAAGLSWAGLRWAATAFHASNWYPLTLASHMLDASLFGPAAWGPHLVNALLHAASTALLFAALRRLTGDAWRAAAAALVFGAHPLQVESVAWIAERKNLLCGFFSIAALWAYAGYARRPSARGLGAVCALFAAALLSKPAAVAMPLALLALDAWPLRRREPPAALVAEKAPLLALSAASCLATLAAARGSSVYALPAGVRLANAALAYAGYLRRLAWPSGLAVFYPHPEGAVSYAAAAAAAAGLAFALALAWRQRARRPWLLTGAAWFLLMLLPMIGLVQVGRQALADRYAYLALIGPALAVVWSAPDRWARRPSALAAAGAALCAMLAVSSLQLRYWRDSVTLYRRAVAVTDGNELARVNLGTELVAAGRVAEGEAEFRAAHAARPDDPLPLADLGYALIREDRDAEAAAVLDDAMRLSAGRPEVAQAVERIRGLLESRRRK